MTESIGAPRATDAAAVALTATALVVRVAGRTVLDGVDLRATAGRMLAVTGPSGAGKSTLLGVLAGLVAPAAGSVDLDGTPVTVGDVAHARAIGLVLQGYGLVAALTASENVELPLQLLRLPRAEVARRAAVALSRAGLPELTERMVEELSGGQQQRIAVARALVTAPRVLIADEPTAELDVATRDLVVRALREEADRGAVVVVATHDPEVAAQCDSELHLVDGRVTEPPARAARTDEP